MNTTQHQGDWNILKGMAAIGRVQQWTEEAGAGFIKAAASIFSRRHPVSSLRVTWAGVLRSDCDKLIPEASEEVRFQVANQMFLCDEGKTLVFDDTWNQDSWDQMNGYRIVFLADTKRSSKEPLLQRVEHFLTKLIRR